MAFLIILLSVFVFYYTAKAVYSDYKKRKESKALSKKELPEKVSPEILVKEPEQPVIQDVMQSATQDILSILVSYAALAGEKYSMSLEEFSVLIIPLLSRYGYGGIFKNDADIALAYDYTDYNNYQKHSRAKDHLRILCNETALVVAEQLKSNYESLLVAKVNGAEKVNIGVHYRCSCLRFFHDNYANVDDMILAYITEQSKAPIFPPPEAPCFNMDECDYICRRVSLMGIRRSLLDGSEHIGAAIPIPDNWGDHLLGMVKERLEERSVEEIEYLDNEILSLTSQISDFNHDITAYREPAYLAGILSLKELRVWQRKYGLSGRRTKIMVAEQLLACDLAKDDIDLFLKQYLSGRFDFLKNQLIGAKSSKQDQMDRLVLIRTGKYIGL
ncbi:hypothetical protein [Methylovulum psychrotolerans]|uniref:NERD domain-containing protein n=1 Tax=Methylovulum psychrotolerans TaxID=1704499 RepID=A0A2S5CQ85_9GAMM|nr:hypothetical protein [Methylovulum psychrotolerans]POZ52981.1 hypothetical protein AADEFJLK_01597 [Methylovulum psychrotolerans]